MRYEEKETLRLFGDIEKARFVGRPNRFVLECLIEGKKRRVYLPNPGRLRELLLPGKTIYLSRSPVSSVRRTNYTAVAVEREGVPVMLDTHHTNTVARWLIEKGKAPGLEGYRIIRSEVPFGRSRFDFLLRRGSEDFVLEVKSCTLFGKEIAMFPDAVTERGRRHLLHLGDLSKEGVRGGVLFIVHSPSVRYFLPEYHTDLEFSRTLYELRDVLFIKAVAVGWKADLSLEEDVRELEIPWPLIGREAQDRGSYILVLKLGRDREINIGGLGSVRFSKGYYLYIGSAMKNLTQRIKRHKRKRKRLFWHIDYLREHTDIVAALAVRGSGRLECELSAAMRVIADFSIPGFGSSDCSCESHLFGTFEDPLSAPPFLGMLQDFRIDRVAAQIDRPFQSAPE